MKTRVYEYAKQHNMSSKEILNLLKRLNIEVANHMSIMEEGTIKRIEDHMAKLRSGAKPEQRNTPSDARPKQTEDQQRPNDSRGQLNKPQQQAGQTQTVRNDRPNSDRGGSTSNINRPANNSASANSDQQSPQHGKNQGKNQERKPNNMRSQPAKPNDRKPQGQGQQRPQGQGQQRPQGQGQQRPQGQGQQRPQGQGQQRPQNNQQRPQNQQRPAQQPVANQTEGQEFEDKVNLPSNVGTEKREKIKKGPQTQKTFEDNKKSQPFRGGGNNRYNQNNRRGNNNRGGQKAPRPVFDPPTKITFTESLTVNELAVKLRKEPAEVIKKLFNLGIMATINQYLDREAIELICADYGIEVEEKIIIDETNFETLEEVDAPESMMERPPVVTIMGHVDHGKTTLLDAIRSTNVVAGEAGGITQHIGAYQVEIKGKKITFLDTPGHAAFTTMRARGAQITDITILVVAADDGVMPQTVEAISHAKAANVPIIVAVNKIDKPEANMDRIKQELTEYELVAEEWGGETIFSPLSAKQRTGIEELLEYILLVSEVQELKANPDKRARGTVVEAELDKGRGPVATILVQQGTLRVGDPIVVGSAFGRVRAMVNDKGRRLKEAGPSTPVEITGLNDVPQAGDQFRVFEDEKKARAIGEARASKQRESERRESSRVSLDDLFQHIQEGDIKELNLIVKGDVQGSVEALRGSLEKIDVNGTRVKIIHTGAGAITESDVTLANASNAIIIGFNVRPEPNARSMAEQEKIDIRLHRVIYTVIEEIESALKGMLDPVFKENIIGQAEIREVFKVSKVGNIAGCYVTEGKLSRDAGARLIREGIVIYEGKLDTLKRFKDDAKDVAAGYECGLTLERFNDLKIGDVIEAFVMVEVKQ
ncbi:translation initiation factor IF-2 [Brevibacillus brevis]|uniref:translation initiation factor IF-2 n=1 Tax=Brevibacillus brevis TaxID=1393 RepID=UPI002DD42325|nr:translation initiation factor IF-2 [Brevibacillus brevis]